MRNLKTCFKSLIPLLFQQLLRQTESIPPHSSFEHATKRFSHVAVPFSLLPSGDPVKHGLVGCRSTEFQQPLFSGRTGGVFSYGCLEFMQGAALIKSASSTVPVSTTLSPSLPYCQLSGAENSRAS